jgi:nucleotide-binding universal stress UspA family protein
MILVPLDGSSVSEQALPFAQAMAELTGAHLLLLRAVSPLAEDHVAPAEDRARPAREASAYLSALGARLANGRPVETSVVYGEAANAIIEESLLRGADLIVMATHGRTGLRRAVYGSVAAAVLSRSTIPVLLVGPTQGGLDASVFYHRPRVLVPLDGSDFAERALPLAGDVAAAVGGKLVLLEAVEEPRQVLTDEHGRVVAYIDEELELLRAQARDYLGQVSDRLARATHQEPVVEVRVGAAVDVITLASQEDGASLVVMATHARGGLDRLLKGSVAESLLTRTSVPLLLVPPAAEPAPV